MKMPVYTTREVLWMDNAGGGDMWLHMDMNDFWKFEFKIARP